MPQLGANQGQPYSNYKSNSNNNNNNTQLINNEHLNGSIYFNSLTLPASDSVETKSQYHKSPTCLLTPGRKSASPTFFGNYPGVNAYMTTALPHQNVSTLNLKIPTTPTRSKSLSPQLRRVVQPPRIRHKQETNNDVNTSYHKINAKQSAFVHCQSANAFKPIMTKCDSFADTSMSNTGHLLKPSHNYLQQLESTCSISSSSLTSAKLVVVKPAPNSIMDDSNSSCDLSIELEKSVNDSDTNEFYEKTLPNSGHKLENNDNNRQSVEAVPVKSVQRKLPASVRMLNLKHFPRTNQTKRPLSIQKIKNAELPSLEANLNILEQNIQFIMNEKFKYLIDECKRELIEPAMKNMRLNFGEQSVSNKDLMYLIINLIDKAKLAYHASELEVEAASEHDERDEDFLYQISRKPDSNASDFDSLSSSSGSTLSSKRKLDD